jgi:hypothetical protein
MLTEKMMEEAIIETPGKYLEEGLTLLSRQFHIGGYIFDLLFEDRHGARLIIELQKGTLDRNHTYKIMDYYDEYKSKHPEQFVELMIIANKIPRERRDRLSSYGIAFKEIPEVEFPCALPDPAVEGPVNTRGNRTQDRPLQPPSEAMPRKGDIFKGKVNDLCLEDKSDWRRRDISFIKRDLTDGKRFEYPTPNANIILIDTDGVRYDLNVTEPHSDDKVCLGTPGRLKPWYQKKGFPFKSVNPDEIVYFEYTGNSNEFLIFTEEEYDRRSDKVTSLIEGQQIAEPAVPPDR